MPDKPLFLERASFHRRRLGDAARVLPVISTLAVLLPVWWAPRAVSYAGGAVWFFLLWAALILAVWALHRALLRAEAATMRASEAVAAPPSPPMQDDTPMQGQAATGTAAPAPATDGARDAL